MSQFTGAGVGGNSRWVEGLGAGLDGGGSGISLKAAPGILGRLRNVSKTHCWVRRLLSWEGSGVPGLLQALPGNLETDAAVEGRYRRGQLPRST